MDSLPILPIGKQYFASVRKGNTVYVDKTEYIFRLCEIHSLIQAVPDQNYIKNEEKFFHAIFHLIFTMVGSDIRSEMHTPQGRIDSAVMTADRIFLFEFKLNESAEDALQCIKDRHYIEHLKHRSKPVTAVGVSFSTKLKDVADWKEEELLAPSLRENLS